MSGSGKTINLICPFLYYSRAIYFWSYNTAKRNVNETLPKANRDTPFVHVTSAAMAGIIPPPT